MNYIKLTENAHKIIQITYRSVASCLENEVLKTGAGFCARRRTAHARRKHD
jgi:hypothetical protein